MATRNGNARSKPKMPPQVYIPCRVEPGMFRGEYLITFEAGHPENPEQQVPVQLLADEHEVVLQSGTPKRGEPVEGLLRVEVLKKADGFALLVLPQPAQPFGERAYVRERVIKKRIPV